MRRNENKRKIDFTIENMKFDSAISKCLEKKLKLDYLKGQIFEFKCINNIGGQRTQYIHRNRFESVHMDLSLYPSSQINQTVEEYTFNYCKALYNDNLNDLSKTLFKSQDYKDSRILHFSFVLGEIF